MPKKPGVETALHILANRPETKQKGFRATRGAAGLQIFFWIFCLHGACPFW